MASPDAKSPLHAMSIDVEDYFHVAALSSVIRPEQWNALPSRVERNTECLLELLSVTTLRPPFRTGMGR